MLEVIVVNPETAVQQENTLEMGDILKCSIRLLASVENINIKILLRRNYDEIIEKRAGNPRVNQQRLF